MKSLNFKEAEIKQAIEYEGDGSTLGLWYESVREKHFSEFSIDDMCKAIRQSLFVYDIMPHVVTMLMNDPHSGDQYDGELISALKFIKREAWINLSNEKAQIRSIIEENFGELDEDIQDDCKAVLKNLDC